MRVLSWPLDWVWFCASFSALPGLEMGVIGVMDEGLQQVPVFQACSSTVGETLGPYSLAIVVQNDAR